MNLFNRLIGCFLIFVSTQSVGQIISNVKAYQESDKAKIIYDLKGNESVWYDIKLTYSTDGGNTFSEELTEVSGDITGVASGNQRKVFWDAVKEVGFVKGDVIFKVEAIESVAMPEPVVVDGTSLQLRAVRGTESKINIEFDLTEKDEKVTWFSIEGAPFVKTHSGDELITLEGRLEDETFNSRMKTKSVKAYRETPIRGYLTLETNRRESEITELRITLEKNTSKKEFIIRNIPVL